MEPEPRIEPGTAIYRVSVEVTQPAAPSNGAYGIRTHNHLWQKDEQQIRRYGYWLPSSHTITPWQTPTSLAITPSRFSSVVQMVGGPGLEPGTLSLSEKCSTN